MELRALLVRSRSHHFLPSLFWVHVGQNQVVNQHSVVLTESRGRSSWLVGSNCGGEPDISASSDVHRQFVSSQVGQLDPILTSLRLSLDNDRSLLDPNTDLERRVAVIPVRPVRSWDVGGELNGPSAVVNQNRHRWLELGRARSRPLASVGKYHTDTFELVAVTEQTPPASRHAHSNVGSLVGQFLRHRRGYILIHIPECESLLVRRGCGGR